MGKRCIRLQLLSYWPHSRNLANVLIFTLLASLKGLQPQWHFGFQILVVSFIIRFLIDDGLTDPVSPALDILPLHLQVLVQLLPLLDQTTQPL